MKIVFVITNLAGGGAEKVILTIAQGLWQRGHETEIVLLEDHIEHSVPQEVKVSILSKRIKRGWFGKRWLAWQLRRHLRGSSATDMVVSALPFANEVAILSNLPHHWCRIDNTLGMEIDHLAAGNPAKAERRLARYRSLYSRRPLITVSTGVTEDLRTRIGLTGRIEQIPNPFNFDAIRAAAQIVEADIPRQPYVIHVGRFNQQKRHDLLLDAWQRLNSDQLLVLLTTDTPALQVLIDQRGLGKRVYVAGFRRNPFPWMAKSELLVLSSDHEGFGNVLIEALACGTRVVSTDCPSGPREIMIGDLAQWLVPCNDAGALSKAMQNVLASDKPSNAVVEQALAPYCSARLLDTWERLACENALERKAMDCQK